MPTIIDSLVIELGLDASGFNKGQKDAVDSLRKLEGDAGKHVKGVQTGFDGLLNTFKEVQGRLLAIGALIAAGLGFNKLIQDTTQLNSQLGYLSTSLGVSAKELSKWETAGKTIGASANEMASAFQSIQDALSGQQVEGGQKLTAFSYMTHQKGQGPAVDLIGPDGKKRSPSDILMDMSRWAEAQQDKSVASYILRNTAGMNQGMTNMLMLGPKELEKRLKQNEQFAPSEEQIKKFQALQEAFGNLLSVMDKLEGLIAAHLAPTLTKILNLITDFLTKIGLGENPGDVAGSTAAKHGFSELAPNPTKPSLAARAWNWLTGKSTDPGPRGAAGSGNDEGANYTPGANRQFVGISRGGLTQGGPGGVGGAGGAGGVGGAGGAGGMPGGAAGGAATEPGQVSSGIPNASLADQRRQFATELQNNPELRDKVMRIMANEQGHHPQGTQSVVETMMNRAIVRGTDLETQARWYGSERGGYYERGNMGAGALENPAHRAILERGLSNALAGSNVSNYGTDNSSGALAARERLSGSFQYRSAYGGETFFAPGTAEPRLASRWDQWRSQTEAQENSRTASTAATNLSPSLPRSDAMSSFNNWRAMNNLGLGSRGALINGGSSNTTNTNSSETHIHEMNVTTPHNADPAAYARGIHQELGRYDNVQNAVTGLQ